MPRQLSCMTVLLHFVKIMLFTVVTGTLPSYPESFGITNYSLIVSIFSVFPQGTKKDKFVH